MYTENGVFIDNATLIYGKPTKLTYNGTLFKQGAEEIYVHLGFGLLWEDLMEVKMTKNENGFEAEIPLKKLDTLNFCFRDNWNNWDNNLYQNYSYEVRKMEEERPLRSRKSIKVNAGIEEDLNIETVNTLPVNKKSASKSIRADDLNESIEQISGTILPSVEIGKSLVPTFTNEFGFRRLPENYIRNKKMRIMFYRMFAYVPRLLNGYNKKRAKSIMKSHKLFR